MTGEFTVEVVDRFSNGLDGVSVVVEGSSDPAAPAVAVVGEAETGFNGRAVFSLTPGTYVVQASLPGHRADPREAEVELDVRLGRASPSSIRIMLLPTIDSEDLAEDAVSYDHIGADSIYAYQIGPGAVGPDELANDAVTGDKIADGAVGARHFARGGIGLKSLSDPVRKAIAKRVTPPKAPAPKPVSTERILDGAVTGDKIRSAAISAHHLSPALQTATAPLAGRIIVATDGGDYDSVGAAAAAIRAAHRADPNAAQPVIIDVMPGLYTESKQIRLPAGTSLRGAGPECTELQLAAGGLLIDDGNECAVSSLAILSPGVALRIRSSAVRVDDCYVSGGDVGIWAEASTLLARGNLLRKGACGIRAVGCAVRLLSNEIEQHTGCGVEIRQSNARVLHNTFDANAPDLDVREMRGGRRCLVSGNVLCAIVADEHARTRIVEAHNVTPAGAPLEPWAEL